MLACSTWVARASGTSDSGLRLSSSEETRDGAAGKRVSVIVPSYRRPDFLVRCIESLVGQTRRPDEILISFRADDEQTRVAVQRIARDERVVPIRAVEIEAPGHLPPIEAAAAVARGEIVVVVDDDVTVPPGWLERIIRNFADPDVGVVGGRVIAPGREVPHPKRNAGQLSWYGHHPGNIASVANGGPRQVATVMECNWAWRRDLLNSLEFDPVVNFDDAAMYGLDLCLQARDRGFRVLYDPEAAAFHHLAPRDPVLDRADRPRRFFAYCRNYTYIILKHLGWPRRIAFLVWWFLVGERGAWGVASFAFDRGIARRRGDLPGFGFIMRAKLEGVRLWAKRRRAPIASAPTSGPAQRHPDR